MRLNVFGKNGTLRKPHDAIRLTQNLHHWWQGASLLLFCLWCIALVMSSLYELKAKEDQYAGKLHKLGGRTIELQIKLAELSSKLGINEASSDWNPQNFTAAEALAKPFYRLSWLDPQGRLRQGSPVSQGDFKVSSRREFNEVLALKNRQGETLVIVPDTGYILGDWLKQGLTDLEFGNDVRIRTLVRSELPDWAENNEPGGKFWVSNLRPFSGRWEYLFSLQGPIRDNHRPPKQHFPNPPKFGKEFAPFPPPRLGLPFVTLSFPIWPILFPTMQIYALVFGVGLLIFGGFGLSIQLTQRVLKQELELAQSKANFTAMVSHELKTPVATLRMYSEMLRDGLITDPKVRDEFFGTMVVEAKRLQRLIENILDLGKIEAGTKSAELTPLEVAALIKEGIQHAKEAYGSQEVHVDLDIEPDIPEILADWDLASQAIANLVHNAFKYGGSHPDILVRGMQRAGMVEIAVLDRGPGIPTEMHDCIFEPYRRLGNEETRTSQGTGLGLALVKACQHAQQGTVGIMNRPGGGAIFTLSFQPAPKGGDA